VHNNNQGHIVEDQDITDSNCSNKTMVVNYVDENEIDPDY